jgi:glycerophosphoryl diester phosphodiesterase
VTRPNRLAAALAAAALFVLPAPARAATTGTCPGIVSHRTAMATAPENTLPGIAAAASTGAGAVEMDVQWSSSGYPVLMHDTTVDRTTDGTGTPASLGLGQLGALSAVAYAPWSADPRFAGTRVPYAGDFMPAAARADLDVLLDVHAAPTELGMAKLAIYINRAGWADRTLIMGTPAWVTSMRGWEPGLRYAVIEYNAATTIRRGGYLAGLGIEAYVVPGRDVDQADVAYWHSYGLQVYAWSSDTPAEDVPATWTRLAAAGVDELITNQPAAALKLLCPVQPTAVPTTMPVPTTQPATPPAAPTDPAS